MDDTAVNVILSLGVPRGGPGEDLGNDEDDEEVEKNRDELSKGSGVILGALASILKQQPA